MALQTEGIARRKLSPDSTDSFVNALLYSAFFHITAIIVALVASSITGVWQPRKPVQEVYAVHLIDPGPVSTATAAIAETKTQMKTDKFETPSKVEQEPKQITAVTKKEKEIEKKTVYEAKKKTAKEVMKEDETPADVVNKQKSGGTIDIKKFPYEWYLVIIEGKIYRNWDTLSVGGDGIKRMELTVFFQIGRNGELKGSKIAKSSGSKDVDKSALEAVNMSTPFPPLPDGYKEDYLDVYFGFKIEPR